MHLNLKTGQILALVAFAALVILAAYCTIELSVGNPEPRWIATILLYAGIIIYPSIGVTLFQYIQASDRDKRLIESHEQQHHINESALQAMREERHDILNELTLVSSYVQMHKWDEAQQCIDFIAASLSDKYNYATLPHDAWLTVLGVKKTEASMKNIEFVVRAESEPPTGYTEQRLLPKLMVNLVDNAFTAALQTESPYVELTWYEKLDVGRFLTVSNNGKPISPALGEEIFEPGISSKTDPLRTHGWGLVICRRIAEELGGVLSYKSTPSCTTFKLFLPTKGVPTALAHYPSMQFRKQLELTTGNNDA